MRAVTDSDLFPDPLPSHIRKVKLAILDTGVDPSHEFMTAKGSSRIHRYVDFTTAEPDQYAKPTDTCGHGTHVAGLILQLAPSVELYVGRVFEDATSKENSSVRDDVRAAMVS